MGNFFSTNYIVERDTVAAYVELSYLTKSEILHIIQLLNALDPGKLRENNEHRFSAEQVETILPQIRCSPFRDSIYRVFSSKKDGRLSLADIVDLCSAFSRNCPEDVRATWAFYIFDFDGDNQISVDDLIEAVRRLTWADQNEHGGIDRREAEHVAHMVLQEMVFNPLGTISSEEFIRFAPRILDFSEMFYLKI